MSRRAKVRAATDKRAISLELARFMGHGEPMPDDYEPENDEPHDPWGWETPAVPLTPIGPTDCQPESRT